MMTQVQKIKSPYSIFFSDAAVTGSIICFRWYWDVFMVCVLGITLLILPINIAFYTQAEDMGAWTPVNLVFDLIFLLDILLNFRTGIVEHDTEAVNDTQSNSKK